MSVTVENEATWAGGLMDRGVAAIRMAPKARSHLMSARRFWAASDCEPSGRTNSVKMMASAYLDLRRAVVG